MAGGGRGRQKQVRSKGCKVLELGGKEKSCGFDAGSPPLSMQRLHRHSHNKTEMPKADKECSYGEGMGWLREDEMFKRFESTPKTRSKRQPLHGVKTLQAPPDHFRLLEEIVG